MGVISQIIDAVIELTDRRQRHPADTITGAVPDSISVSRSALRLKRARRVISDGPAFERINRHGAVYYAKSSYRVLNPYSTEGTGLQFVKGGDRDPTGVFFTKSRWATPDEEVEAVRAYLFSYGIPREDLAVLPATAWPHTCERTASSNPIASGTR